MFEVHYNNPGYHSGIVDSSGLEIMLTPKLRKYDSGLMTVGHDVTSLHLIPPGMLIHRYDILNLKTDFFASKSKKLTLTLSIAFSNLLKSTKQFHQWICHPRKPQKRYTIF